MSNQKQIIIDGDNLENYPIQNVQTNINELNTSVTEVDIKVNEILSYLNLPTENIVVPVKERMKVYQNLEDVVNKLETDTETLRYLSKFVHAVTDGLFDAALNYLWDAVINELRLRISNYDVEYFYDVIINNTEKRSKISGVSDLEKIQDAELLRGAKEIELINKVGYQELDHIRNMRNWASSAHPNEVELTGLKIVSWLETCVENVFNLPASSITLEIKKLLADVRTIVFSESEITIKKSFLGQLTEAQINPLINGLFGIYVSNDSTSNTKDNIAKLAPTLWSYAKVDMKTQIGVKYGNYSINGHQEKEKNARDFLEIVSGQAYIPKDLKVSEVMNILSDLRSANNNMNNFYTEPSYSHQLRKFVSEYGELPSEIEKEFVLTVIYCFITNGNGVAWNAEEDYLFMIQNFSNEQALIALTAFIDDRINERLSLSLCAKKFKEMLKVIEIKIVNSVAKEMLDDLKTLNINVFKNFENDSKNKAKYSDFLESFR